MHKTKQSALKAARKELGSEAVETVDFQLRNTGAGWVYERIAPANEPAKRAQRKRQLPEVEICDGRIVSGHRRVAKAAAERRPVVCRDVKTGERSLKMAVPKETQSKPATKTELLIEMMRTPDGSTSKAMEEAASWASHSVRGLVGSLKKRGVPVESLKDPGQPVRYRIPADETGDVI